MWDEYPQELRRIADRLEEISAAIRPVLMGQANALHRAADDIHHVGLVLQEATRPYNEAERRQLDADFAAAVYNGDTDPAEFDQS